MTEAPGGLQAVRTESARADEQARFQADLQALLEEAKAAQERMDAAWAEEAARTKQTEAELVSLQEKREALYKKFTEEQQTAESKQGSQCGDNRMREAARALPVKRIRSELAKRTDERALEAKSPAPLDGAKTAPRESKVVPPENSESTREREAVVALERRCDELEKRLKEATSAATCAAEAAREEAARYRRLEMNLANLRDERNQIHDRFIEEHRAGAKAARRIKELENRLQETAACLKQAKAELNQQARDKAA